MSELDDLEETAALLAQPKPRGSYKQRRRNHAYGQMVVESIVGRPRWRRQLTSMRAAKAAKENRR